MLPNSPSADVHKGGAEWERFDWRGALKAVCNRHIELLQEPHIAALLDGDAQVSQLGAWSLFRNAFFCVSKTRRHLGAVLDTLKIDIACCVPPHVIVLRSGIPRAGG